MLKEIIKNNFVALGLALVLVLCYINGCFKPTPTQPIITVVHDTVWIHHDSTVYSKPEIVHVIKPIKIPSEFKPDTSYEELLRQYSIIMMRHFSTYIYKDSLKIDSLGSVATVDTVTENKIVGRKWDYSLKERTVTNTITIKEPYKPRNQVYIGGGVGISPSPSVHLGLLFKNKQDFIMQPSVTYSLDHGVGVQISAFGLIKLHK